MNNTYCINCRRVVNSFEAETHGGKCVPCWRKEYQESSVGHGNPPEDEVISPTFYCATIYVQLYANTRKNAHTIAQELTEKIGGILERVETLSEIEKRGFKE